MLGLRIDYVTGQRRATLLKAGESYVGFAYVYWPEDSPVIGLLICGTREVRIAYNTKSAQQRPFSEVSNALNASVKDAYGVDPERSLPSDCNGTYYQEQFRRKYPNLPH